MKRFTIDFGKIKAVKKVMNFFKNRKDKKIFDEAVKNLLTAHEFDIIDNYSENLIKLYFIETKKTIIIDKNKKTLEIMEDI
jgi:hypothetical protein